jgi:hypothetical protein
MRMPNLGGGFVNAAYIDFYMQLKADVSAKKNMFDALSEIEDKTQGISDRQMKRDMSFEVADVKAKEQSLKRIDKETKAMVSGINIEMSAQENVMYGALDKMDERDIQNRLSSEQNLAMMMEQESEAKIATEKATRDAQSTAIKDRIQYLKLENQGMKENATQATQNLGANLGLLFSTMALGRAFSQTAMYLQRYGILSEKQAKVFKEFTDILNLASTVFGAYVSLMMLLQALDAKRFQQKTNENIQTIVQLELINKTNDALKEQTAIKAAQMGTAGAGSGMVAGGAATGMASAIPYVGALIALLGIGLFAYSMYKSSKHALGGDEIVTSPTWKMVGENGPERFSATPMSSGGGSRGGDSYIFNGPIYGDHQFRNTLTRVATNQSRGVSG